MNRTPPILTRVEKFRDRFPNPKNVAFLMMRFANSKPLAEIHKALKTIFDCEGINLVRADENEFDPVIWTNVLTYMESSCFGVAVLEQSSIRDYNPNVALEVGYMLALGKPVCILKEKSLPNLPTDLLHHMYVEYDHFEVPGQLNEKILRWMRDNCVTVACRSLTASFKGKLSDFDHSVLEQIAQGIVSFGQRHGKIRFLGVDADEAESRCVLHFEADSCAANFLKEREDELKELTKLPGFEIHIELGQRTSNQPTNLAFWTNFETKSKCVLQICLRDSFEGMDGLNAAASCLLPPPTSRIEEIALLITKTSEGFWYFHSNYQPPSIFRVVKLMATEAIGLRYVIEKIISINGQIADGLLAQLQDAHVNKIRYIFDPKVVPADQLSLPLDSGGAKRIEILPHELNMEGAPS